MQCSEIISLFRTEVNDIEMPYLWADEEVLAYLNDAYIMFTRFLGGVSDSTSAVTTLVLASGQTSVELDEAIIRVVRAFRASDGSELSVIENTDMPLVRDATGKLSLLRVGSQSGPVEFLIIGAGQNSAAIHPTPAAIDSIKMQVRRIPLSRLGLVAGAGVDASPVDIRSEHHIHLIAWMKATAYRKQDAETMDNVKAQESEDKFLQYCAQSVHEQERMRRKSRVSLRSARDLKNPMLAAKSYSAKASNQQEQP